MTRDCRAAPSEAAVKSAMKTLTPGHDDLIMAARASNQDVRKPAENNSASGLDGGRTSKGNEKNVNLTSLEFELSASSSSAVLNHLATKSCGVRSAKLEEVVERNVVGKTFDLFGSTTTSSASGSILGQEDAVFPEAATALLIGTIFVGGILLLRFLYRALYQPLNRVKPHHKVGYEHLGEHLGQARASKERAALVNWVNRRKVLGDLLPVFPNGWFAILESDGLSKESVRHVQALGENFAVFRDAEGTAHVLDAYCPHLGANLAIGGKVRGNCIECPFHAWKFDGNTGKCASIPYSAGEPPPQAKIKVWTSKEELGFIMVWYHAEGIEPYWKFPKEEGVSDGKFSFCGRSEHYISTHIQDMPENGADIAHLNVLHKPGLPAGTDLRDTEGIKGRILSHVWSAEWALGEQGHTTSIVMKHSSKLLGIHLPFIDVVAKITQVGPGFVILRFESLFGLGNAVLFQSVTPVEPLLQKVVHRVYFSNPLFKFCGKILLLSENIMFERDIAVWNSKKFMKNPIIVKEDKLLRRYRSWFSQFFSENSPTLDSVVGRDSFEW